MRTFLKDLQEFGSKQQRSFLGFSNSAVVVCDDGKIYGYAGEECLTKVVDAHTGLDGHAQVVDIPLDFRTVGIAVLSAAGVTTGVQAQMFANFMRDFTKDQRTTYVTQYNSIDASDTASVQAFVGLMVSLLNY